jgi:hypothetical protein
MSQRTRNRRAKRATAGAYLDTSVFVMHFFGHPLQKAEVLKSVGRDRRNTCTYCFTEIKNTARALIEFYFILSDEKSVGDALRIVANDPSPSRRLKKIVGAVGGLLNDGQQKAQALAIVANQIYGFIDASYEFVSEVLDSGLSCPLSDAKFSDEPGLTTADTLERFTAALRCEIDDPPKCNQDQFRAANKNEIDLIAAADVKNPGTQKLQEFLRKLARGRPPHARGLRYRCSKIGDMIIALQCPPGRRIVSSDRAFEDLARLMDRDAETLASMSQLVKRRDEDASAEPA